MTNDNNTRTKANAVFFSVLMVISMVAVGFAAAPAAAADATDGEISFNEDQVIDSSASNGTNTTVDVTVSNTEGGNDVGVVITYDDSGTTTVAGVNAAANVSSSDQVSVELDADGGNTADESAVYTAHLFNQSDAGTLSAGDPVTQSTLNGVTRFDFDTTVVYDENDGTRSPGVDDVYNESVVYQGEDGLVFVDNTDTTASNADAVSAASLQKDRGDNAGTSLSLPLQTDEDTGTYSTGNGYTVTVQEPRITTAEVQLNGNDVSQVSTSNANNNGQDFEIVANWNFGLAENIEVTVEDPSGADITDEVLQGGTNDEILQSPSGNARVDLDLSTEDAGEYTVTFEGSDDLDQDSVVQEYTIEITSQDQLSLETAEESVTRGDNLDYTVSGGTNAQQHIVAIGSNDFRDGASVSDAESIFRNVDDVEDTGLWNTTSQDNTVNDIDDAQYAYAVVEIDGTTAVGSIETQYLDDASIDVDVYDEDTLANESDLTSVDDVSFDVNEGEVSLGNPTDTYTVGSEVDINGTAQSADNVAIYARDNSDWELLDIDDDSNTDSDDYISVDSDDTFEEEDIRLSSASNIYSFEGQYDIGVVDTSDLSDVSDVSTLTTSQFSSASSARYTLQVEPGNLNAEFGTINGQIADDVDDDIDVTGSAAGQDELVIAFVGQRGDTVTTTTSVDSDDTFEEEDVPLGALSQGSVTGHVISPGRDGQYGNGDIGSDAQSVANAIDGFGSGSSTGDQIRSQILENTVDDTGSDDLIVSTSFRLNDPTLSINNVYPEAAEASGVNPVATGETLVIEGDTNRQADNAAITFEMLTQEDQGVASTSVDEWENDGQFSATIDTSDLETGTYVLEADDGESTDRVNVEIVEERQTDDGDDGEDGEDGEDGSTDGDDGSTDGDDGGADGDDGGSDGDDGGSDGGDGGTDDSTPGFGALVALVALIAAALLATRRDN